MFDRQPIPPEHDLRIKRDMLEMTSQEVWEAQDVESAEEFA